MSARFQNREEGDLFDQFQTADRQIRKKTKILLPDIKKSLNVSYENLIFIIIGFIMSCIIFFSLGVEKGRQDTASVNITAPQVTRLEKIRTTQQPPVITQEEKPVKGGYVIQLAAFSKKQAAEQAREDLRKKGYSADVRQSGEYYQLYIGIFDSFDQAEAVRGKIKDKYKDCYVKKY